MITELLLMAKQAQPSRQSAPGKRTDGMPVGKIRRNKRRTTPVPSKRETQAVPASASAAPSTNSFGAQTIIDPRWGKLL
jgi:hypothetical protein